MKLKGAYIALITFALHLVVGPLIKVGDPIGTGGSTGLMSIPSLKLGGYVFSRTQLIPWYFVALLISFLISYTSCSLQNNFFFDWIRLYRSS